MATQLKSTDSGNKSPIRDDYVPKEPYYSKEWAELEKKNLWPKIWQVACREEELPKVGSYITYDICDESFIVVRTAADTIKAFYNVCPHRGRRLTEGCGSAKTFICGFHGWTWHTDGRLLKVIDHDDWQGCSGMDPESLALKEVRVETWSGFVFINMDENAEPLRDFLEVVPHHLDPLEQHTQRYRWYKSVRLPCNWKVALETFNEGYHINATHTQYLNVMGDDETRSLPKGKHGSFGYPTATRMMGAPSKRTGKPVPADYRPGMVAFFQLNEDGLKGLFSSRDNEATKRLMTEVAPDTPPLEVFQKAFQFQKESAIASGAGWPDLTLEQFFELETDWHIFPNLAMLPYADATLAYRSRPDPNGDPEWCVLDIWSLMRYAPGAEPPLEREFYYGDDDWKTDPEGKFYNVAAQDLQNLPEVQRGMRSQSFKASRTNPLQETNISNFHRVLYEYVLDGEEPNF